MNETLFERVINKHLSKNVFNHNKIFKIQKSGLNNLSETKFNDVFNTNYEIFDDKFIKKSIDKKRIDNLNFNYLKANYIFIINGIFCDKVSSIFNNNTLNIQNVNNIIYNKYYNKSYKDDFASLNIAINTNTLLIKINSSYNNKIPLVIYNIFDNNADKNNIFSPRKILDIDINTKIDIVEIFDSYDHVSMFINDLTFIECKEKSNISYSRIYSDIKNSFSMNNIFIRQMDDSVISTNMIELNNKFLYNKITFELLGDNCNNEINGLYIASIENTYINNYVNVNHLKPNSNSNQLYKGVLNNSSNTIFTGKIKVFKDAIKTKAYQSNSNIILGDNNHVYIKPILEIYADDVKCSHGATSSYLDESLLFYLNSRCIDNQKSIQLLILAHIDSMVDKLHKQFSNTIMEKIKEYF
ncbi:MAG: SufD family Fe-S cluster assembly protein [Bacteroides sp.]|nr:MAG: SufD family Fe-S cluster assembly protein [Bacteroides sp.]